MFPWCLIVTGLYWSVVFEPEAKVDPPNGLSWFVDISFHAINLVFILIEFVLGGESSFFFLSSFASTESMQLVEIHDVFPL